MAGDVLLYSREDMKYVYNHLRNRVNEYRAQSINYDPSAEEAIVQALRIGEGDPEIIKRLSLDDGTNPFRDACKYVLREKKGNPVHEWFNLLGPYICDTYTFIGSYNSSFYIQYMYEFILEKMFKDPKCSFWGVSCNIKDKVNAMQPLINDKTNEALILDDSRMIRFVVFPETVPLNKINLDEYVKSSNNNYVVITADMNVVCATFGWTIEEIGKLPEYLKMDREAFEKKYPSLSTRFTEVFYTLPKYFDNADAFEKEHPELMERISNSITKPTPDDIANIHLLRELGLYDFEKDHPTAIADMLTRFGFTADEIKKFPMYFNMTKEKFDEGIKKFDKTYPGWASKLSKIYDTIPKYLDFWRANFESEYLKLEDRLLKVDDEKARRKMVQKVQEMYCKPSITGDGYLSFSFMHPPWIVPPEQWGTWGELAESTAYIKLEGLCDKKKRLKLKYALIDAKGATIPLKNVFKEIFVQLLRRSRIIPLEELEKEVLISPSELYDKILADKGEGVK